MVEALKLPKGLVGPLGILLFSVGLLLGMTLLGATVWADFEAVLFDPGIQQDASLRSLRCPVLITPSETGTVRARLFNPLERPTQRYVSAHITDGYVVLMREEDKSVSLEPGQRQDLTWTVTADDAAFERLILVNVVLRGRYPLPSRKGTCGILVVGVPFMTGKQILGLTLGASLLMMAAGLGLWFRAERFLYRRRHRLIRAMGALAAAVLVGLIVALAGWWLPGLIIFFVILLGIGVIIGHFLNGVGG